MIKKIDDGIPRVIEFVTTFSINTCRLFFEERKEEMVV
jgi:hypothetical protein